MRVEKVIVINGVRYHADRPSSCRRCRFWKNSKKGCVLGKRNCYYLAGPELSEQELKCEGCPYTGGLPCVTACCYKDLAEWFQNHRDGSR